MPEYPNHEVTWQLTRKVSIGYASGSTRKLQRVESTKIKTPARSPDYLIFLWTLNVYSSTTRSSVRFFLGLFSSILNMLINSETQFDRYTHSVRRSYFQAFFYTRIRGSSTGTASNIVSYILSVLSPFTSKLSITALKR